MAELKKLIPGDTLLAVIRKGVLVEGGKPTGSPGEYLLFYGNVYCILTHYITALRHKVL